MLLAILFAIIGMACPPLLLAVEAGLVIDGIGADLVAMILPAALPLAFGLAANGLGGAKRGTNKGLAAVGAGTAHRDRSGRGMAAHTLCARPRPETEMTETLYIESLL
jgi:hypothetical protein